MSNISNPLQLRADRPLEAARYATLLALHGVLKRLECPYMLVGATARDILLYNVFGQPVLRATQDVDIAILIDSWERFQTVKTELLQTPDFHPSTVQPYRVLHKTNESAYPTPIDILPFGEIATEAEAFRWPPPDTDLVMNVAAFADAYESSVTVAIGSGFDLQIASISGLVLLKLLAWVDKAESKQAQDVLRLIETYGDSGNEDRLYSEKIDLLEAAEFDFAIAGAHLLAQDALELAAPSTIEIVRSLLRDSRRMNTFRSQMAGSRIRLDESIPDQSGILLGAFVQSFLDAAEPGTSSVP
jgi:predicted nucleotidyltransferase